MAITVAEKTAPEWFTPVDQEHEESPAQYRVQPLDQVQLTEVMPGVDYGSGQIHGWAVQRMLQYGLIDWRNINKADGTHLPFKISALRQIPYGHQTQAASHILYISTLSEDERKNF